MAGEIGRLVAVSQVELPQNVTHVILDSSFTDEQIVGYFLIAGSRLNFSQNF
jgi:hypothetical protein